MTNGILYLADCLQSEVFLTAENFGHLAGAFADEHDLRRLAAVPKHHMGPGVRQRAAPATENRPATNDELAEMARMMSGGGCGGGCNGGCDCGDCGDGCCK